MRRVIAGNWKMNATLEQAAAIIAPVQRASASLECDLVVCPPATLIHALSLRLAGASVALGGQDCHAEPSGAHTGDISAAQLLDAGASWVILGHSERRSAHGETDDQVRSKALAAQAAGLIPIVCVGETQDQRVGGDETEVVGWQIEGSLPKDFRGVLAYEPVWAIGTGRQAKAEQVEAMHAFIREELVRQLGPSAAAIRILYGGSVNPDNAPGLLAIPEVDGALVGGASLDPAAFLAIAQAADKLSKQPG